jgi:broad specificity phosphatase PhoE
MLLTAAPTAATAAAAFPSDEPLDARGRDWAEAGRGGVPRAEHVRYAPARACRETCAALGLVGHVDPLLRGWDVGSWSGRSLDDLAAERPDQVALWVADPNAAPHGGESLVELTVRVRKWLTGLPPGRTLVVCEPAIVRAVVVVVLAAAPAAFWSVDVSPMTLTDLRGSSDRWTLRSTAVPIRRSGRTPQSPV